jgi:hypothetical protein
VRSPLSAKPRSASVNASTVNAAVMVLLLPPKRNRWQVADVDLYPHYMRSVCARIQR